MFASFCVSMLISYPSNFRSGIILRVVVDYLDLHLLWARVLSEYAPQSFFQILCTRIARRYYYRPERAVLVDRRYAAFLTTFCN